MNELCHLASEFLFQWFAVTKRGLLNHAFFAESTSAIGKAVDGRRDYDDSAGSEYQAACMDYASPLGARKGRCYQNFEYPLPIDAVPALDALKRADSSCKTSFRANC